VSGQEWIAIAAMSMTLMAAIIGAVATLWGNRDTRKIKGQVVNGHGDDPPLRDDIDSLKAQGDRTEGLLKLLVDRQLEQGRDIGGIREELRVERQERIAGDQR
jgi:hypothetical protein